MTVKELMKMYPEAVDVELYRACGKDASSFHTDSIDFVANLCATGLSDDDLKMNVETYKLMDEEDYDNSINANSEHADFAEWYDDAEALVLVAIVGSGNIKMEDVVDGIELFFDEQPVIHVNSTEVNAVTTVEELVACCKAAFAECGYCLNDGQERVVKELVTDKYKDYYGEGATVDPDVATDIADEAIETNRPFDFEWLNHIKRTEGNDGLWRLAYCTASGCRHVVCNGRTFECAVRKVYEELKSVTR